MFFMFYFPSRPPRNVCYISSYTLISGTLLGNFCPPPSFLFHFPRPFLAVIHYTVWAMGIFYSAPPPDLLRFGAAPMLRNALQILVWIRANS